MYAALWYIMDTHAQMQIVINDYNNPSEIRLCHVFCLNLPIIPQDQSALLFRSAE